MLTELEKSIKEDGINNGTDNGIENTLQAIITNNPRLNVEEIAKAAGISIRNCWRIIAKLKQQGVLKRVGTKKGYWVIVK